jgi:hypothetical protein
VRNSIPVTNGNKLYQTVDEICAEDYWKKEKKKEETKKQGQYNQNEKEN